MAAFLPVELPEKTTELGDNDILIVQEEGVQEVKKINFANLIKNFTLLKLDDTPDTYQVDSVLISKDNAFEYIPFKLSSLKDVPTIIEENDILIAQNDGSFEVVKFSFQNLIDTPNTFKDGEALIMGTDIVYSEPFKFSSLYDINDIMPEYNFVVLDENKDTHFIPAIKYVDVNSDYTQVHNKEHILVDCSSNAVKITARNEPELGDELIVSDTSLGSSTHNITIVYLDSNGNEQTLGVINTDGGTMKFIYDGQKWFKITLL